MYDEMGNLVPDDQSRAWSAPPAQGSVPPPNVFAPPGSFSIADPAPATSAGQPAPGPFAQPAPWMGDVPGSGGVPSQASGQMPGYGAGPAAHAQPQMYDPRTLRRATNTSNQGSLVALGVSAVYVVVNMQMHLILLGFIPLSLAMKAVGRKEPLAPLALVAAIGVLGFGIMTMVGGTT